MQGIIKPKEPKGSGWIKLNKNPLPGGFEAYRWHYPEERIVAISGVEVPYEKDGSTNGPEYHLSVSRNNGRIDSKGAKWVLSQFGLDGTEEDNHVQHGIARHFWRPVNESLIGRECPCKKTETRIVEDKGDYILRAQ